MNGPAFWVPERVILESDRALCRWIDGQGVRFTDPFFEDTLARCRRQGRPQMTTPLEQLEHWAAAQASPAPVAFLFHVSRCGSTLFSQLLSLDERFVVLSEVPVLDDLLISNAPDRARLFDSALRTLGSPRFGDEQHLFVKMDSWHLSQVVTLREWYPETPFLLLYRSPSAVLRSHQRVRGRHMVPGLLDPSLLGLPPFEPVRVSLDQYAASVLEQYFRALLEFASRDARCLLVNYDEGFPAAFLRACSWLQLTLDDIHRARVEERARFDAKRPREFFSPSPDEPLPGVDLAALDSLFVELESKRISISA